MTDNSDASTALVDPLSGTVTFSSDETSLGTVMGPQCVVKVKTNDGESHHLQLIGEGTTYTFDARHLTYPIRTLEVIAPSGHRLAVYEDLFPRTNQEFAAAFKTKSDRPQDPVFDYFIGRQLFESFPGAVGYRISSAVVCSYKAMEMLRPEFLEEAASMLQKAWDLLPETKIERSVRLNRENLTLSVLCAQWQLHLARGEPADFLSSLMHMKTVIQAKDFQSFYNPAYNASLSLRLLTVLYRMADAPAEAHKVSKLAFEIYQLAARDADRNLIHFRELGYVHTHVYETMRLARREKRVNDYVVGKNFQRCVRISEGKHEEAFRRMKDTFLDAARSLKSPAP